MANVKKIQAVVCHVVWTENVNFVVLGQTLRQGIAKEFSIARNIVLMDFATNAIQDMGLIKENA